MTEESPKYREGSTRSRAERERIIVDMVRMAEPYGITSAEIRSATDMSPSTVSRLVLALEKRGTLLVDRTVVPHVYELNDVDSERDQVIGQNGPVGYHDTDNDLEPDALTVAAESIADDARRAMTNVELGVDKLEALASGRRVGIDPLPKDDERIRDLVKMKKVVTPSIKRSIDSLIEYVTRDSVV